MGVFDLSFEKPKPVRVDQNLSVVPPSATKPKVAAKATTSVAPKIVTPSFKTEKLPTPGLYDLSKNPLSKGQIAGHLKTINVSNPLPLQKQTVLETPAPKEGLNMTKAIKVANWINAANAVSAIGMGIYGLNQVDKMEAPNMVSAPIIEAKQIRDSGAQQMAARKSAIATSANTTRDALRRSGRTDLLPAVSAKEMSATNEAAAAIEGLRTNIEAQNVAAENRVREINASSKVNTEQFNAQLQNSFRQFQSQMKNSILNTSIGNVSSNIAGIGQNLYTLAAKKEEDAYKNKALLISSLGQ